MTVRGPRFVGQSVARREDQPLLNGTGRFWRTSPPGMLHVAFLRSSRAHARIRKIDVTGARSLPE
jgi:carbon-monoxide dehydrogenase large subunit